MNEAWNSSYVWQIVLFRFTEQQTQEERQQKQQKGNEVDQSIKVHGNEYE